MNISDISTAQSNEHDNAQDDENTFNLRNYGLTDLQFRFVNEYLIDLNRTAAYKRAGGNGEGNTAYVGASRMYRNAKVNRAIRIEKKGTQIRGTQAGTQSIGANQSANLRTNTSQASIKAGYSEKTANRTGSFLLSKIDIQNRISELMNELNAKKC